MAQGFRGQAYYSRPLCYSFSGICYSTYPGAERAQLRRRMDPALIDQIQLGQNGWLRVQPLVSPSLTGPDIILRVSYDMIMV